MGARVLSSHMSRFVHTYTYIHIHTYTHCIMSKVHAYTRIEDFADRQEGENARLRFTFAISLFVRHNYDVLDELLEKEGD